jgi:hypothetical protein
MSLRSPGSILLAATLRLHCPGDGGRLICTRHDGYAIPDLLIRTGRDAMRERLGTLMLYLRSASRWRLISLTSHLRTQHLITLLVHGPLSCHV